MPREEVTGPVDAQGLVDVNSNKVVISAASARGEIRKLRRLRQQAIDSAGISLLFGPGERVPVHLISEWTLVPVGNSRTSPGEHAH